jgi:pilus assembly protein Flp/PilA
MGDQSAATAVEYGLLVGVFSLGIVFGMNALTNQIFNLWHVVESNSVRAMKGH